jgi:DNA-binding XRE family transcriptional regulator
MERVAGIEPALSAWESERNTPSLGLTCQLACLVVSVPRRS